MPVTTSPVQAPEQRTDHPLVRVELIRVRSFRGIEDCVLPLEPKLTVIVGRNSSGKSRLLRAIAIACGATSASVDDFTVGSEEQPVIDLILAPGDIATDAGFDSRIQTVFGNAITPTSSDGRERIGWRTTISRSAEGWGARAQAGFLNYDASVNEWTAPTSASALSSAHRNVLAADLVETGRDLATELTRPGSPIRRILDRLEVSDSSRTILESEMESLGQRIVSESATLEAVRTRLTELESVVSGIGTPDVHALPGRLEELVRTIEIALDTGRGSLPMRLHGSGAKSLSSLQLQSVLYERRLGRDGSATPTHPLTLIEEPEAHLHPSACFELESLLGTVPGQVVISTHSSHVASVVPVTALRLVRNYPDRTVVRDLTPKDNQSTTPAASRIDLSKVEWEKIRKYVERPFGEALFASVIVIGDGASERAFLPELLRFALGARAAGVCVVDPQSASQSPAMVKFAESAGIPCVVFLDCDVAGRQAAKQLTDYPTRVWCMGDSAVDGSLDEILNSHDSSWVIDQCAALLPAVTGDGLTRLKQLKGTYGRPLGRAFVEKFSDVSKWPLGFRQLIEAVEKSLEEM